MIDIEVIAEAVHDMNRAYSVFLGDDSLVSWDNTEVRTKEATRVAVQAYLDYPDTTPESTHDWWRANKEANGWVYGKKEDPVLKTDPLLKDYGKLPKDRRAKDAIFKQMVIGISGLPKAPTAPPKIPAVTDTPRTSPEPRRQKGFVKRPDTVVKAPTSNTKGSGGSLRGRPVKPMDAPVLPRESVGSTGKPERTGGLIKSGAGDGAAALAMFDNS